MRETSIEEAVGRKYPEWVTLVVSGDGAGQVNAMPAGWVTFTSIDPVMLAVSVGHERYTYQLMKDSAEFVVTFPSSEQKKDVYYCGNNSGADVDKFSKTSLRTEEPSVVSVPLIKESVVCYECEKRGELVTGDHTIFSGEIVAAHVSEEKMEKIYTVKGWHEKGHAGFQTVEEMVRNGGSN
ncbi:MAG: flavin reductase family protein [Candidatus Acetothermia bacterium]